MIFSIIALVGLSTGQIFFSNAVPLTQECQINYMKTGGKKIIEVFTFNAQECAELCARNAKCQYWDYKISGTVDLSMCKLRKEAGFEPRIDVNYITGKRCPMNVENNNTVSVSSSNNNAKNVENNNTVPVSSSNNNTKNVENNNTVSVSSSNNNAKNVENNNTVSVSSSNNNTKNVENNNTVSVSDNNTASESKTGLIIGVVVGVLVTVIIIACIFAILIHKLITRAESNADDKETKLQLNGLSPQQWVNESNPENPVIHVLSDEEYEIAKRNTNKEISAIGKDSKTKIEEHYYNMPSQV
eukprot:Pgem_evm1s18370